MKEVTMPKLSDTMTEGTVVVWRKSVGDQIARGEVIAEVETDKATMELEAFASGVLLEIRVEAGKNVPVGTVIGMIGKEGEQPEDKKDARAEPASDAEPETRGDAGAEPEAEADAADEDEEEKAADSSDEDGAEKEAGPETAGSAADREVPAAPVVRRRAREFGIDLADVTGSGPDGRILLEDLKPSTAGESKAAKAKGAAREESPAEVPSGKEPPQEAQEQSRMRAAIARTVTDSWQTIPHFSVTAEVRMDAAEQLRQQLKADGTAVSMTALLVKATALGLDGFPRLNASLRGKQEVLHPEINIGIVVRRDEGLLVPVLRGCGGLSLAAVAERAAQLIDRARHGQLSDTELTGGTFAISNLGMFGVHSFVALILPPMAAVLATGAVRDGVIVQDGRPAVARLLLLTLSADHRLVDGVYAAEFLQALKQLLENPAKLAGE
ncbi:MAG: 2-oxo acid dehydrogenase subunit E2 [Desulfuromonadales bacterium]|nr:2-oxo acid dehydrogenase subunit E2 [Desulfuromonadales bacterium]